MKEPNKLSLGIWPTPLYRLDNMSSSLGTNVWIKRDDMCGVALGGNKVRKLEYLLWEAKNEGCTLVMTTGQAQSNHAMLTAACCRRLGLDCVLVLKKRGVTACRGNQILNRLLDVEVRFVDTDDYSDIYAEMDRIAAERGQKAYKIPCGGSSALGSVGYVDGMREIAEQSKERNVSFRHIVCACGSGGTAAGTALGASIYMPETQVTCSKVDTDPFEEIVPELMRKCASLLEANVPPHYPSFIDCCGAGYSIPSPEGNDAMRKMMQLEGIVLDTCYTGKAFSGLLRKAERGDFKKEDNVLFIHTGGAAGLFAQDWENMK